jgi:hypothetical protein
MIPDLPLAVTHSAGRSVGQPRRSKPARSRMKASRTGLRRSSGLRGTMRRPRRTGSRPEPPQSNNNTITPESCRRGVLAAEPVTWLMRKFPWQEDGRGTDLGTALVGILALGDRCVHRTCCPRLLIVSRHIQCRWAPIPSPHVEVVTPDYVARCHSGISLSALSEIAASEDSDRLCIGAGHRNEVERAA